MMWMPNGGWWMVHFSICSAKANKDPPIIRPARTAVIRLVGVVRRGFVRHALHLLATSQLMFPSGCVSQRDKDLIPIEG